MLLISMIIYAVLVALVARVLATGMPSTSKRFIVKVCTLPVPTVIFLAWCAAMIPIIENEMAGPQSQTALFLTTVVFGVYFFAALLIGGAVSVSIVSSVRRRTQQDDTGRF